MNTLKLLPLIHCVNLGSEYQAVTEIPENKIGFILNIIKYTNSGKINLYYKYRLEVVINLYKSNKIEFIMIGINNCKQDCETPSDFKNDLIDNGIPENKIHFNYNNFNSLDGLLQVKRIFGLKALTIIS